MYVTVQLIFITSTVTLYVHVCKYCVIGTCNWAHGHYVLDKCPQLLSVPGVNADLIGLGILYILTLTRYFEYSVRLTADIENLVSHFNFVDCTFFI